MDIISFLIPYDMQALEIVIPMFRSLNSSENCQLIIDFFLQQDNCFKVFIEDVGNIISSSKSPLINEFYKLSRNFIKESLETNNLQIMDPAKAIIHDISSGNNVFFKIAKKCLNNFQNFSDFAKNNIIAYINAFIITCYSENDSQILLNEIIFPLISIISENDVHDGIIFTILCTITTLDFIYPFVDVNFWTNLLEIAMNRYENNTEGVEIEDFVCFIGNIIEICVPFEEIKNENQETIDIQIMNYGIPKEQIKDIMITIKESLYNIVAFKDKKELIMMLINLSIHSEFYEIIPELMDDISEILGENEANGDDTLLQNLYFVLVKAVSRKNEAVFHDIVESFLNSDALDILEELEGSLNKQIAFYATKILTLFENIEIE
ncbi:hypothetical protein TVAG_199150 [Trichomonas vaginalis G3]|uniref:Uncharacterized protein n=1 Tax=Trichomonas vaginalis (strain ATCC PRA-98 / G3) TaxID=412133 RepID=A2DDV0_TRIV3|nr:hypothetical protein TVAGG3_0999670 [Trichomonas vaginalis G3]EAY21476.1 hypothetical protein TVAG_199150 [Trichomonas vaginalis G3]KAI5490689.1 hypothetical protein TVAGG3_0999670 [Trichomonas vaginalis G3]|eukprot:XP_001582462.1 hypothetical protein [Trichomonas vaginalis G3]